MITPTPRIFLVRSESYINIQGGMSTVVSNWLDAHWSLS